VLQVVEHQEAPHAPQGLLQSREQEPAGGFAYIEGTGDGGEDEGGVCERGQGRKGDAARIIAGVGETGGDVQGQTGLADATGAGQREQAHVAALQEVGDGRFLVLAPDQRRERGRQPGEGQR